MANVDVEHRPPSPTSLRPLSECEQILLRGTEERSLLSPEQKTTLAQKCFPGTTVEEHGRALPKDFYPL